MFGMFKKKAMEGVDGHRGWDWRILEPFSGAWQKNIEWNRDTVLAYHAIFACITLIASDISKMRIKMVRRDSNGIWIDAPLKGYEVLDRPNQWQNSIQFFENWINSKLIRGNTYILKRRDQNDKVIGLYVLSPDLVTVLVSDSGEVFYQLSPDNLSRIEDSVVVPASEIIHDRFNCFFHPLVGLSPIFASGLAAFQGIKIQENYSMFFQNMSQPGGILSAPGHIDDDIAKRLKEHWEQNYKGKNYGKVAVLGDDLKYTPLAMTAEQSQLVEQLKLTAEIVCSTFHVPSYKVIGNPPSYNNIEALEQQYYSQCLQILIESIEYCLDQGLGLEDGTETRFDLDSLLRMDSTALYEANSKAVVGGWMKPDEARKRVNMSPVPGGDTPYLQEQNYSLAALSKRDAKADPFNEAAEVIEVDEEKQLLLFAMQLRKELSGENDD